MNMGLVFFFFLALVNSAARHMCVYVQLEYLFLGYIPRSRIAGPILCLLFKGTTKLFNIVTYFAFTWGTLKIHRSNN